MFTKQQYREMIEDELSFIDYVLRNNLRLLKAMNKATKDQLIRMYEILCQA